MRVEANVTSGLLATDSSAVELVPLLQAEVRKLREMLTLQRMPVERERDFLESQVVEGMRKRVSELETQLAEREKLIDSLDLMRREELLREEEELERMFLINGEGRDFRADNPYNLYKNDVKYKNYNNDYDMNYNTYTNSDHKNHHVINNNSNINNYNDNSNNDHHNNNSNISIVYDSSNSRNDNRYQNIQNSNNISHIQNSLNSTIHDRNSWDSGRSIRDNSKTSGPGSPSKSKSNHSYPTNNRNNNHNYSNDYNNNHNNSHIRGHIEGQSCSVRSILTARDRGHGHETGKLRRNMSSYSDAFSDPPPPPPPLFPTPTPTPISASTSTSVAVARSQPVVLLSEDAVDVSYPRVINLNQVRKFTFSLTVFVFGFTYFS